MCAFGRRVYWYTFFGAACICDYTVGFQPGRISEVPAIRRLAALVCRSFQQQRLDGIDLGQRYAASRCNASCGDPRNSCNLCIGAAELSWKTGHSGFYFIAVDDSSNRIRRVISLFIDNAWGKRHICRPGRRAYADQPSVCLTDGRRQHGERGSEA